MFRLQKSAYMNAKSNIKLGVSINYWDCGELLQSVVANIRPHAYHLSIVFQTHSNFGNIWGTADKMALERVMNSPIGVRPDAAIRCERPLADINNPKLLMLGGIHETAKRNAGLDAARSAGCTHYMSMDADEFYIATELEMVKLLMDFPYASDGSKYDVAVCQMQTYYKSPSYRIVPPEDYYVPIMYRFTDSLKFVPTSFPVLVDPSRRCEVSNPLILSRNSCQMHHMSYVRSNIARKLINSSAMLNFDVEQLKQCISHYNNWQYPQQAMMIGKTLSLIDVESVENVFGVLF